jgi:hypothetical protein
MKAMIAYIEYIGKDVPKEEAKLWDLWFRVLDRPLILAKENQYTMPMRQLP